MKKHTIQIIRNAILTLGVCAGFISCNNEENPTVHEARERAEIMKLHKLQRDYHFENKAEEFVDQFSVDFTAVNRGYISKPKREASIKRFGNYFSNVTFEHWDDLTPPEIHFSDDYSVAYSYVHKNVVVSYPEDTGETLRDTTVFSWVAIYKKYEGEWKIDCVATTQVEK